MAILYAPIIDNQLKAFYCNENDTLIINIPFQDNPLMGDYQGIQACFKTSTGVEIGVVQASTFENNIAHFEISNTEEQEKLFKKFTLNWFYKFQLAYYTDTEIGPYTQLSPLKYTTQPTIADVKYTPLLNIYSFVYDNSDKNETLSKFKLIIKSADTSTTIEESDWITDTTVYKGTVTLSPNTSYYYSYNLYTINGLNTIRTGTFAVDSYSTGLPTTNIEIVIGKNEDNGINVIRINNKSNIAITSGKVYRSDNIEEESESTTIERNWYQVQTFSVEASKVIAIKDNSISSGKEYLYGFYFTYNSNKYFYPITKYAYRNDYPHMFISDGDRQLCVKFNPDISSFKTNIQNQKVETLGEQYPLFFTNGKLKYNEFALTGLISYWSDENGLFYSFDTLVKGQQNRDNTNTEKTTEDNQWTTQLTGINYRNEREFKLEVLNWLNNGKYKLLRTPQEGNYIVNIMNVSLAPEKTTGRLLHTFSATAYESAEFNYENLVDYSLLPSQEETALVNADLLQNNPADAFIYYTDIIANGNMLNYDESDDTWISIAND